MEAVIHHFKLMTEGLLVRRACSTRGSKAARASLATLSMLTVRPGPIAYMCRASFNNLYAIDRMSRGGMLSDIVTNIGTLDIVLGDVDR